MDKRNVNTVYNQKRYSHPWKMDSLAVSRVSKIVQLVGSQKRVLDVGCYDGTITSQIMKNGNTVIGVDNSLPAIRLARKKGVTAHLLDLEKSEVPKAWGKFDVVVAGEIIEHLIDTDSFVDHMKHALKPGGYVVITTPNLAGIGSRISLLMGKTPWMIENEVSVHNSGHIRYFTPETLSALLRRHKFTIDKLSTDTVGFGAHLSFPLLDTIIPSWGRIIIIKAHI